MDDRMTISQLRLNGVNAPQLRKNSQPETNNNAESFKEVLGRNVLKFSHHARGSNEAARDNVQTGDANENRECH